MEVEKIIRGNSVKTLELYLKDRNYLALKKSAMSWIEEVQDASIWNVFVIGNIKTIEAAIDDWNRSLNSFSSKIMSNEPDSAIAFTAKDPGVVRAKAELSSLRDIYTTMGKPTWTAIGIAALLYLLLLAPYIIQRRNTKSIYTLWGQANSLQRPKQRKQTKPVTNTDDSQDEDSSNEDTSDEDTSDVSDYGSFSM
jgi:hypothetical protein